MISGRQYQYFSADFTDQLLFGVRVGQVGWAGEVARLLSKVLMMLR